MRIVHAVVYFSLLITLWIALTAWVIRAARLDRASALHYSLLMTYSLQGLCAVVFSYAHFPVSFSTLSYALLVLDVTVLLSLRRSDSRELRASVTKEFSRAEQAVCFSLFASYLTALVAGLCFFSLDLIPSSMTGDPPRHYLLLTHLEQTSIANQYKPIYYLWAGGLVSLPITIPADQLFVGFNIFLLGLAVGSATLLVTRVVENISRLNIGFFVSLTAFGYQYFALQYGYYTLLLSSAFLFSVFAYLVDDVSVEGRGNYFLTALLVAGVILTHSYFVPELCFALLGMSVLRSRVRMSSVFAEVVRCVPFWIALIGVVVFSNPYFGKGGQQMLEEAVRGQGFGTGNLFGNVLPFCLIALPWLLRYKISWRKSANVVFLLAAASFTFVMWELSLYGRVHDYYVNRNLLVLLPLLTIGMIGSLVDLQARLNGVASAAQLACIFAVAAPYLIYRNSPLPLAKVAYLDLLNRNSEFIYLANARVASYSPLQFTASDRRSFQHIYQDCEFTRPIKMAVLGTDHEVPWFGIYTGISAPLAGAWSDLMFESFNKQNYKAWIAGPADGYIASIKHLDYTVPKQVKAELEAKGKLVCQGDSFAIYKKVAGPQ
jgi:hypothetical protein